jgi:hypothetical protein
MPLPRTRKQRGAGKVRIAKYANVYGTNFPAKNNMTQNNLNLRNSRKSTQKTPRYAKEPLNPEEARVFANLWAKYNDPKNMILAIEETALNEKGKNRLLDHILYLSDEIIRGT